MKRSLFVWVVGSLTLVLEPPRGGSALFLRSPQQLCDSARVAAWQTYLSYTQSWVALDARGWNTDEFQDFAIRRHIYFSHWNKFQTNSALAGSTCVGSRFTDNGTTVTDNLTGLQWEKKTTDGSAQDQGDLYPWSASGTAADGGAFQTFMVALNPPGACLGGQCDWRLPTMEELQTLLLDFTCTGEQMGASCHCPSSPCIDATFGPTQPNYYWSATSSVPNPSRAWNIDFNTGNVISSDKPLIFYVRAVRGGF